MREFTRTQFTDYNARDVWKPRFQAISKESRKVEIEAMMAGYRRIAMPNLSLLEYNQLKLYHPFKSHLLAVHNAPKVFHAGIVPFKEGEPFSLRTVIGGSADVDRFLRAYADREEHVIGRMLGYPDCCVEFFIKHWVKQCEKDFTWPMMEVKNGLTRAVIDPIYVNNQMYIKLGLRPIYHMPCSIRCLESKTIGEKYLELWGEDERIWLDEILRWPCEWSALHGAAEIRTPVCKIITDTEPTNTEHVIQFPGRITLPKEAARGNRFPYTGEAELYSNNGFTSEEAMTAAHEVILKASNGAENVRSICEPGSGNGLLLHKLDLMHVGVKDLLGIDINHHAVDQGRRRFSNINFIECNLFDVPNREYPAYNYKDADMVVFMPGRLLEHPDKAEEFVKGLNFRYLLLYGYSVYAHKVWDLKNQYWPDCRVCETAVSDHAIAILLDRP